MVLSHFWINKRKVGLFKWQHLTVPLFPAVFFRYHFQFEVSFKKFLKLFTENSFIVEFHKTCFKFETLFGILFLIFIQEVNIFAKCKNFSSNFHISMLKMFQINYTNLMKLIARIPKKIQQKLQKDIKKSTVEHS